MLRVGMRASTPYFNWCLPIVQLIVSAHWYCWVYWNFGRKSGDPQLSTPPTELVVFDWVPPFALIAMRGMPPLNNGFTPMPGTVNGAVCPNGSCTPCDQLRPQPIRNSLTMDGLRICVQPM